MYAGIRSDIAYSSRLINRWLDQDFFGCQFSANTILSLSNIMFDDVTVKRHWTMVALIVLMIMMIRLISATIV